MRRTDESHIQPSYGIRPQHRLPDETHVGHVTLQVSDLQRSVEYYSDVLGMAVLDRRDTVARLGVGATGQPLAVLQEKRGIGRAPRAGRFGLYHFAVLLPDRPSLGRFAAHLFASGVRPGMADHAVSEALYLTDPNGLGIEVYADRSRGSWTQNRNELVMVTEPLDIADVIASGKGNSWREMPEGTVMGHIHLHVGDINRAEAFYHATLGFDKTVWSYPGALFVSAGGYHHHVATNVWSPGPSAGEQEARLLEWELIVPSAEEAARVARRLAEAGYAATDEGNSWTTADPWGTRVRIVGERA
jgi:catechol 2,3-dioxygenase